MWAAAFLVKHAFAQIQPLEAGLPQRRMFTGYAVTPQSLSAVPNEAQATRFRKFEVIDPWAGWSDTWQNALMDIGINAIGMSAMGKFMGGRGKFGLGRGSGGRN